VRSSQYWILVIVIGTREAMATGGPSHGQRMGRGKPGRDFSKMIQIRPMNVSTAIAIARC
jgi:hypothetical protein